MCMICGSASTDRLKGGGLLSLEKDRSITDVARRRLCNTIDKMDLGTRDLHKANPRQRHFKRTRS